MPSVISMALVLMCPISADIGTLHQIFVNQMEAEAYLIRDALNQTKSLYHIEKDQFSGVGSDQVNDSHALSQNIPSHFCIENIYAFVNTEQQIQVNVIFKSQEDNTGCSNLIAGTSLQFLALGDNSETIQIDSLDAPENNIVSFACVRPPNDSSHHFGLLKSFESVDTGIDLVSSLSPPLNQCALKKKKMSKL
jgi:hypothetical protein